jgi:hypothetical protein
MMCSSSRPSAFALLAAVGLSTVACGSDGASTVRGGDDASSSEPSGTIDATAPVDGSPSNDGAPPDARAGVDTDTGPGVGGESVTLRFADPSAYTLYASLGGGPPHRVQLDTGSIGLYAPKSALGPSVQISTTACSITYVSSGTTLAGHEATAPVALLGSTAAADVTPPPTTSPMTFCAVDDATFTGGMMGVGFGRGASADPTRNVLLQMAAVASGSMRAGYVLSTHPVPHVDVGIAPAAKGGFAMLPLTKAPSGNGDWLASSLRGCLAVPSEPAFGAPCGPLLVDTGVPECLLWGPSDPTLGGAAPAGATSVPSGVALRITGEGGAGASVLDYAFVVGQAPDAPSSVDVRKASAFSINTGRALLVDYDYLFDAVGGAVGFRRAAAITDGGAD